MHQIDLGGRQGHARVGRDNGRVVPHRDLAQEDVAQQGAGQAQLARCDAVQIDHRHHAADGGRELAQAGLLQFGAVQWLVGRAEIHGAGLDLRNAAAGADRLVIDLVAGGGVVVGRPLGHQRVDEGSAGTGDFSTLGVAGGSACGRRALCGVAGLCVLAGRTRGQGEGDGEGQGGQAGRLQFHGGSEAELAGVSGRSHYEMMFLLRRHDRRLWRRHHKKDATLWGRVLVTTPRRETASFLLRWFGVIWADSWPSRPRSGSPARPAAVRSPAAWPGRRPCCRPSGRSPACFSGRPGSSASSAPG